MKSIPLNTEALCTDGRAGKSTCVIVEPTTLRITHFVVADRKRPHTKRIVPSSMWWMSILTRSSWLSRETP